MHLCLEVYHLLLVLSLLVKECLLLLLEPLLDPLLVLHDPVQGVPRFLSLSLAFLPRIEKSLHLEYFLIRRQFPCTQLD